MRVTESWSSGCDVSFGQFKIDNDQRFHEIRVNINLYSEQVIFKYMISGCVEKTVTIPLHFILNFNELTFKAFKKLEEMEKNEIQM